MAMDRSGMIMGIESGLGGFKRIVPSFEGPGGGRIHRMHSAPKTVDQKKNLHNVTCLLERGREHVVYDDDPTLNVLGACHRCVVS